MKIEKKDGQEVTIVVSKLQLTVTAALEYCLQCKRLGLKKPKLNGRVLIFTEPSPISSVLFTKTELESFQHNWKQQPELISKDW